MVIRRWLLGACLGMLVSGLGASSAFALSSTPDNTWVTDIGRDGVHSVAQLGGTTYLAGAFSHVGPRTGPGVAIDKTSAQWDPAMPQVSGGAAFVEAVTPDGAGGWYIGGAFTHVGGLPRANIAHILPNKTVDSKFAPNANNAVLALAVSGSTVYAGGEVTSTGGQARNRAAALGASNGQASGWNPNANGLVDVLLVSGSTVYAGGDFSQIGGQAHNDIAALRTSNGQATAWNPNADGRVHGLALSGSTVYAGGEFGQIGGQARNHLAAVDATSGTATAWNPSPDNEVDAIVVS